MGKEPELVVGLTSTHSKGSGTSLEPVWNQSGTSLLQRGWTLFHSGVAIGERHQTGVAILIAPRLGACMLGFTPVDERVGGRILTVIERNGPPI